MNVRFSRHRTHGFSLVELLAVIAILIILMGLAGSLTNGAIRAMDITASATEVENLLRDARETALLQNREVEIRIYEVGSDIDPTLRFREIAAGVVEPVSDPSETGFGDPSAYGFRLIRKRLRLGEQLHFIDHEEHSSILTHDSIRIGAENREDLAVPYRAFTLTPVRGTSLHSTAVPWTLTVSEINANVRDSGLPLNFATLIVSPHTGRTTLIRP